MVVVARRLVGHQVQRKPVFVLEQTPCAGPARVLEDHRHVLARLHQVNGLLLLIQLADLQRIPLVDNMVLLLVVHIHPVLLAPALGE